MKPKNRDNLYYNVPEIKNVGKRLQDEQTTFANHNPLMTEAQQKSYQQAIDKHYNASESTDSELIFNWDSEYKRQDMANYHDQTEKQLQFLDQLFNDQGRKTNGLIKDAHDYDGKRIVNNTKDRQWFKDYVALVFSIGCIFNATDQRKLNEILKLFENSGDYGFLMNYHKVMSYEDPLIKAIEQKMEIGNGNYHLCLITIVQTQDPKILAQAPEQKYSYSGTIEKFCEWNDIYDYMKTIIARYGLMTPIMSILDHKTADTMATWEIGNEGKATKTARHTEVESNFDIDIDPEDENQIMLNADIDFKHEQSEHFKPRVRTVLRARASENDNPERNRVRYNKSLYTRIAESNDSAIQHDSVIDKEKGVQLRLNEAVRPPPKRQPEYQLYEDDSTYQNGRNVMEFTSDQSSRQYIPTFQHLNRQSNRQGNRTRTATSNPLSIIKTLKTPQGI